MAVGTICEACGKVANLVDLKADPYPWIKTRWLDDSGERHYCSPDCMAQGSQTYAAEWAEEQAQRERWETDQRRVDAENAKIDAGNQNRSDRYAKLGREAQSYFEYLCMIGTAPDLAMDSAERYDGPFIEDPHGDATRARINGTTLYPIERSTDHVKVTGADG